MQHALLRTWRRRSQFSTFAEYVDALRSKVSTEAVLVPRILCLLLLFQLPNMVLHQRIDEAVDIHPRALQMIGTFIAAIKSNQNIK